MILIRDSIRIHQPLDRRHRALCIRTLHFIPPINSWQSHQRITHSPKCERGIVVNCAAAENEKEEEGK